MPDVWYLLLFEIGMDTLADTDQAILVTAGQPQQLQLSGGRSGVRHKLLRRLSIRGRRETAYPRKSVEMCQTEVQGLSAAHGQASERAVFAVGLYRVPRLDCRDHVIEQVPLKCRERGCRGHGVGPRPIILLCPTVGHDHNNRHGLSVR